MELIKQHLGVTKSEAPPTLRLMPRAALGRAAPNTAAVVQGASAVKPATSELGVHGAVGQAAENCVPPTCCLIMSSNSRTRLKAIGVSGLN